jgi:hypothetical protein
MKLSARPGIIARSGLLVFGRIATKALSLMPEPERTLLRGEPEPACPNGSRQQFPTDSLKRSIVWRTTGSSCGPPVFESDGNGSRHLDVANIRTGESGDGHAEEERK